MPETELTVISKPCHNLRPHEDHLWETPTDYFWCSGVGYSWYVGAA